MIMIMIMMMVIVIVMMMVYCDDNNHLDDHDANCGGDDYEKYLLGRESRRYGAPDLRSS